MQRRGKSIFQGDFKIGDKVIYAKKCLNKLKNHINLLLRQLLIMSIIDNRYPVMKLFLNFVSYSNILEMISAAIDINKE